jgi:hypothetical protein
VSISAEWDSGVNRLKIALETWRFPCDWLTKLWLELIQNLLPQKWNPTGIFFLFLWDGNSVGETEQNRK